ncbi:MAG: hypothetical protein ACOH1E_03185 [Brevundimonas sp.]
MTDRPEATPTPTNPRWVRITVICLIALVWIAAAISIVRGESWTEAGFSALIATFCLSAVDLGLDLRRKRRS